METITAIRCENIENGYGMFAFCDQFGHKRNFDPGADELDSMRDRHERFNTPREDRITSFSSEYFCAYHSLEQFMTWVFEEELQYLVSVGFRVYELTLSECLIGKDNIVFKKEHILSKIDITDQILNLKPC